MLQQGQGTTSTATTIIHLLCASPETWYEVVYLPRCQRSINQEWRLGMHQGTKLRRMREENRSRMNAHSSPTPNLPRSQLSGQERRTAYDQFNSELMDGTNRHRVPDNPLLCSDHRHTSELVEQAACRRSENVNVAAVSFGLKAL